MTAKIQFLEGDATHPAGSGNKIIAHVCNDAGKWGKGFALALSERWRQPRGQFLLMHSRRSLMLGMVQLVPVEKSIWVANMIAQRDIVLQGGVPPIRYDALLDCLKQLGFETHQRNASIHMPRIAGGEWEKVERLLRDTLPQTQIFVYNLPPQ